MASREGSSTSRTTNSQEQSPALAAVLHLMDQTVQTAMQPIASELRSLMNKIQTGTLPAPRSNATPALNGGELSGAGDSSSGQRPIPSFASRGRARLTCVPWVHHIRPPRWGWARHWGHPIRQWSCMPTFSTQNPIPGLSGGFGLTGMPSFSGLNPVPGLSDGLNFMAFTEPGGQNPTPVLNFPFPFLTHQENRSRTDRAIGILCLLYVLVRV